MRIFGAVVMFVVMTSLLLLAYVLGMSEPAPIEWPKGVLSAAKAQVVSVPRSRLVSTNIYPRDKPGMVFLVLEMRNPEDQVIVPEKPLDSVSVLSAGHEYSMKYQFQTTDADDAVTHFLLALVPEEAEEMALRVAGREDAPFAVPAKVEKRVTLAIQP